MNKNNNNKIGYKIIILENITENKNDNIEIAVNPSIYDCFVWMNMIIKCFTIKYL